MNKAIQLIILCGLILLLVGLYSCDDPIPDEVEDLYPQEQIPWPTLADTPYPMVRHDPQGTNRSSEAGVTSIQGATLIPTENYYESPMALDNENGIYRLGTKSGTTVLEYFNSQDSLDWDLSIEHSPEVGNVPSMVANDQYLIPNKRSIWKMEGQSYEALWENQVIDHLTNVTIGLSGELYFITGDPKRVVSLDNNGAERWTFTFPVHSSLGYLPIVISPDGEQIYFADGAHIFAFSTDGEMLWQYPALESWIFHMMIDNAGNIYYVSDSERSIVCLTQGGDLRWQTSIDSLGLKKILTYAGPTIDYLGNLYYTCKDTNNVQGVISLDNEGYERWFRPYTTVIDLLCDKNNRIYLGYSWNRDHYMGAISKDGDCVESDQFGSFDLNK